MTAWVALEDIHRAEQRIHSQKPCAATLAGPLLPGCLLKLEYRQPSGAFKLCAATNRVLPPLPAQRACRVVSASTGNHGCALARAPRAAGARAVVCLSHLPPANKVQSVRDLGAELRIIGQSQDEAMVEVARAVVKEGLTEVPSFDHPDVVAGQRTLGLEILVECPAPDAVLLSLSGGELAAGRRRCVRCRQRPGLWACPVQRGAAMARGAPVAVQELATLPDSLGGGSGLANRVTLAMCRALLDDVDLVNEHEIAALMRHIHFVTGDRVEGAAAVDVAALLSGWVACGAATVCILSGANVAPETFARKMEGQAV